MNGIANLFEAALSYESSATVARHCAVQVKRVASVAASLVVRSRGTSVDTRRVQQGRYFGMHHQAQIIPVMREEKRGREV
jgi:hypothetical protein